MFIYSYRNYIELKMIKRIKKIIKLFYINIIIIIKIMIKRYKK